MTTSTQHPVCPRCGAPAAFPAEAVRGTGAPFPKGPNGGVLIARRVPGTDEWVTLEHIPPSSGDGDDVGGPYDDYRVIDPIVVLKVAAIILNVAPKTLYRMAPNLASAVKIGGRWMFKTELLYTADLLASDHSEARTYRPRKEEVAATRQRYPNEKLYGITFRGGSHTAGCHRQHTGPCPASLRKRPNERSRAGRGQRPRSKK